MPKVFANEIEFYYQRHGKGDPLIFICGFTNHLGMWEKFISPLSQNYEIILFDNRGAGRTDVSPPPYTIDQLGDDVVALMDALGISKAYMAGSSMGTAIIQSIGLRYPERLLKGVLIAPFHTLPSTAIMQAQSTAKLFEANIDPYVIFESILPWLFSNDYLSDPERVRSIIETLINNPYPQSHEGYVGQLDAITHFDSTKTLEEIKNELLIIAGEEDLYTPLFFIDVLIKKLPFRKVVTIPKMGHMPYIEAADLLIKEICAFCKSK